MSDTFGGLPPVQPRFGHAIQPDQGALSIPRRGARLEWRGFDKFVAWFQEGNGIVPAVKQLVVHAGFIIVFMIILAGWMRSRPADWGFEKEEGESDSDFKKRVGNDAPYFGVVTWSTLGYGDISPVSGGAKTFIAVSVLIFFFLQIFFGTDAGNMEARLGPGTRFFIKVVANLGLMFAFGAMTWGSVKKNNKIKTIKTSTPKLDEEGNSILDEEGEVVIEKTMTKREVNEAWATSSNLDGKNDTSWLGAGFYLPAIVHTTVGYGDYYPTAPGSKTLIVFYLLAVVALNALI